MTAKPKLRSSWPVLASLCGVCLTLAACSGGDGAAGGGAAGGASTSSSGAAAQTLTIAVNAAPQSFDPSHADNGTGLYPMELAYEPLIWENDNDTFSPGLATSWHYIGTGNKQFQLTLRTGAKFSDGEPVTAQAVANSLNYFPKGFGPTTADLAGVTASATGADTVTLTSKTANPVFPLLLSQDYLAGDIISPAALKNPGSLTGTPSGAGPYVLDSAATVSGDQYTFTADPHYYDPARIHYKNIVIKVISSPTSELSALQTGQVNLMFGSAQLIPTARSAGLDVTNVGAANWNGIFLLDRDGTKVKALASPLVRQALNYAVDRASIAKAVYGVLGSPDDQPTTPGFDEYVPSLANYYSYNVTKAKQLLAQAGYPNGFTMPLAYAGFDPQTQEMVQAIAQEWSAVGVKVQLTAAPTFPAMSADMYKSSGVSVEWGGQPMFIQVGELWKPNAGLNPYHATNASFLTEFNQASAAPQSQVSAAMARLGAVAVTQAFTVPVAQIDTVVFSRGVSGIPSQLPSGHLNVAELHP